jgi:putative hydrolase of the HAD superfamily
LAILGFNGLFREIVTVEDGWRAKPNPDTLGKVLALAGVPPAQCLFVGDRYDIDLRLPAERGCPVILVTTVAELLQLGPLAEPPDRTSS